MSPPVRHFGSVVGTTKPYPKEFRDEVVQSGRTTSSEGVAAKIAAWTISARSQSS